MEKSEMEEYNNVQPPNISKYSDGYLNIDEVSLCAAEHTHTHIHIHASMIYLNSTYYANVQPES